MEGKSVDENTNDGCQVSQHLQRICESSSSDDGALHCRTIRNLVRRCPGKRPVCYRLLSVQWNVAAHGFALGFQEVITEEFDDGGAKDSVSFAEKWYVAFLCQSLCSCKLGVFLIFGRYLTGVSRTRPILPFIRLREIPMKSRIRMTCLQTFLMLLFQR